MIKPQKKSKSVGFTAIVLTIIMITGCFTTACQPTPGELVVQNKGDGELEVAIQQTAALATDGPEDVEEPTQEIRITDTRTNDAETVIVNIDAGVILPGDNPITVAKLESYCLTQEDVDRVIEAFFGDNPTFYDSSITTKDDILATILSLQLQMTDDEAMLNSDYAVYGGITDLEDIKSYFNKLIEEQQTLLSKAPEEAPVIEYIDINSESYSASVGFNRDYMGRISFSSASSSKPKILCYAFNDNIKSGRFLYNFTTTEIDANANDSEFSSAKQAAQDLINEMGLEGVRIGDVFISSDNAWGYDTEAFDAVVSEREFYVFCFEREVGSRTIDFTFYEGNVAGDDYDKPVPYERIEVWVEGNEIVKFQWLYPAIVTEIVNENTALQIDYEQALDTAVNQIFINYVSKMEYSAEKGYAKAESISAEITSIEFEMVRMKEKDTGDFISVPTWKFYGNIEAKFSEDYKIKKNITEDYQSLTQYSNIITINALDGSIIDMEHGY